MFIKLHKVHIWGEKMIMYSAVIDPGATNTKIVVRQFEKGKPIVPDIAYQDSVPSEPVEKYGIKYESAPYMMFELLRKVPEEIRRNIKSISVISHGATENPLDAEGRAVFGLELGKDPVGKPVYATPAYSNDMYNRHHNEFFQRFDPKGTLYLETGSSRYSEGINAAQQLFFHMTEQPEKWAQVTHLLPLSSYMAFLLSGEKHTTHTHTRNHAYLERIVPHGWEWGRVVRGMGIERLFPDFRKPFEKYGKIRPEVAKEYGLPEDCIVVDGGHDTSAVAVLAPNYTNTGSWICNIASGVGVELHQQMDKLGIVVNADHKDRNLRTLMARLGVMRTEYRKQYAQRHGGDLPEDVPLDARLLSVDDVVQLAFMNGVGVYRSAEKAELPQSLVGKPNEFIHQLAFSMAIPEALSSIVTSDDDPRLHITTLSQLLKEGYKAKDVVIGGDAVLDVNGRMGTFTELFRRVYPGTVRRFTFPQPTSYAAHILAVCAFEGIDPDTLGDRLVTPTEKITFRGSRESLTRNVEAWERKQARLFEQTRR